MSDEQHPSGYAQPGPQYAQPQPPQPPDPRKSWFARHKILTGIGAVVAFSVVVSAFNGGGDDADGAGAAAQVASEDGGADAAAEEVAAAADASEPEPEAEPEPADLPTIGEPARDGKFEFTVTEVEDGVETVGDDFLNKEAQGQFVLVHMSVENIGDEAQYFDGGSQELVDTEGRTHSADSEAAIYLDDSNSFLNEINPGNTVEGVVVFDLPKKATPATLQLHDSMFSGGVEVSLQ
ncbi:DUF4352 domain-containing protein [Isoptericola jiangsuensis]|uniref:DUF4352 domain-containing protein n=1 Tax=Isoptericola jiangsuensis TaxID=548579 RepID=UPI003AB049AA